MAVSDTYSSSEDGTDAADVQDDNTPDEKKESPAQKAKRWEKEFTAAMPGLKKYWKKADKIVERFKDKRNQQGRNINTVRVNLYASNVQTMRALLYGQVPKSIVSRRFADASDDVARVAGLILERILNIDTDYPGDTYAPAMGNVLDDRLISGLGVARVRYECDEVPKPGKPAMLGKDGKELAPAVEESTEIGDQHTPVDYVNWRDFAWSPCRTANELRWTAFKSFPTKDEAEKRFGKELVERAKLNFKKGPSQKSADYEKEDGRKSDPWSRAEVWEIWDKENGCVDWWSEGCEIILDTRPDPYGLDGFWPFERPMMANLTTSSFMPTSDYELAQDLYDEFDLLSTRIHMLTKAVKVAGTYDKAQPAVARLLNEAFDNDLIPADNWSQLTEKGGINKSFELIDLSTIVAALDKLTVRREEVKQLLYEVTGMADNVRGAAMSVGEESVTATEARTASKYASIRLKRLQDEFAGFCSGTQRIKAELICRLYTPENIIQKSGILETPDGQMPEQQPGMPQQQGMPPLIQRAVDLLKSEKFRNYRIEVKPESIALADMGQVRSERVQVVEALSQYMAMVQPLMESAPSTVPGFLEMLKWVLAGFQGSREIEGTVDQMVMQFKQQLDQQQQQGPQPDPKAQAAQMKAQADLQKQQADSAAKLQQTAAEGQVRQQEIESETNAEVLKQAAQAKYDTETELAKARIQMELEANKALHQAHLQALKPPPKPPVKPNGGAR